MHTRMIGEGSVEYRDSRFHDSALFPDNEERTCSGWGLVLRQSLGAGPVEGSLFGALDRDDAREDWWVSSGWRAGGQATWRIASPLLLGVTGEYRAVDYDEAKAAGDPAREDRILQLGASLTWAPWRHGSISVTASRTRDDSNLEAYTYTRTIYGVVVTLGI